jgi:hypothetical protein
VLIGSESVGHFFGAAYTGEHKKWVDLSACASP